MSKKLVIINTKESKEIIAQVIAGLKGGNRVKITNLGMFYVRDAAARKGRNPSTGEPIDIPASRKVKSRVSSVLKREVLA